MTKDEDRHGVIWQGKAWNLYVTDRRLPDGSIHESAYIDHPGSVVIVPWQDSAQGGKILMLRQYRHSLRKSILELPAGTREWGEDIFASAQRELREETGFSSDHFDHLGQFWPAPGVTNEAMSLFLARDLHHNPLSKDIDEEIEVIEYNFDDLFSLAISGQLQDAKTIVGILRTAFFLHKAPFDTLDGNT
jgi:ADP-ribose pyrophosphatase